MSKISTMRGSALPELPDCEPRGSIIAATVSAFGRLWMSRLNRVLISAVESYERRAEARRHANLLRRLDDHVLKDIGISRADAEREASALLHNRSSGD